MNLDVTLLKVLLGENASKEGTHELPLKVHVKGERIRIRIDDEGTIFRLLNAAFGWTEDYFRLLNAAFGWTEDYWDRMLDGDVTSDQASKFRKICPRVYFQFEESWKAEKFHILMQRLREISGGDAPPVVCRHK